MHVGKGAAAQVLLHENDKRKASKEFERHEAEEAKHAHDVEVKHKMDVYMEGRANPETCPTCLRWYVTLADSMYLITRKKAWFENFILTFIFGSSITISISTYDSLKDDEMLATLNTFILIVFVTEVIMKVIAEEFRPWLYFIGPFRFWNNLDFLIVMLSVLEFGDSVRVLRLLRLVRLVKILNKIPRLRTLINGLLAGIGQIAYIATLMLLIFYLYAILGIVVFRQNDPVHWLDLGTALTTLFRMSTLEDWTDVYYINYFGCDVYNNGGMYVLNVSEVQGGRTVCKDSQSNPFFGTFYFFSFIVISSLVLLSMFIGAISMSMSESVRNINEELARNLEKKSKKEEMKMIAHSSSLNTNKAQTSTGLDKASTPPYEINRLRKLGNVVRLVITGENRDYIELAESNMVRNLYYQLSKRCHGLAKHKAFTGGVMTVIICSAVVEGVFTDEGIKANKTAATFEKVWHQFVAAVFLFELIVKVVAEGFHPFWFFFAAGKLDKPHGANFFDTVIVLGSYIPGGGNLIIILRTLRLLTVFKLATRFPKMRLAVDALICGLASIGYIGLMMLSTFYFFAIFAVLIFKENDPWHFGNLHLGMITLFRMATLEDWTDVMYINQFGCDKYIGYEDNNMQCIEPYAYGYVAVIFFVLYTIFGSLIMLNLFIGVIVTSMEEALQNQEEAMEQEKKVKELIAANNLEEKTIKFLHKAYSMMDLDESGEITVKELKFALDQSQLQIKQNRLEMAFRVIAPDFTSVIKFAEFAQFCVEMRKLDGDVNRIEEIMQIEMLHDTDEMTHLKQKLRCSKTKYAELAKKIESIKQQCGHREDDRRHLIAKGMAEATRLCAASSISVAEVPVAKLVETPALNSRTGNDSTPVVPFGTNIDAAVEKETAGLSMKQVKISI